MKSRRDFLKATFVGGVLAAVGDWGIGRTAMPDKENPPLNFEPSWCTTIFCQFHHSALKDAIETYAGEAGCQVDFGRQGTPDVIAVPAFIQIVDRNCVGADIWQNYVAFSDDVHDDTPCVLVDKAVYLPMPITKYVVRYDLTQPDDINEILAIVRQAHLKVPSRKMMVL